MGQTRFGRMMSCFIFLDCGCSDKIFSYNAEIYRFDTNMQFVKVSVKLFLRHLSYCELLNRYVIQPMKNRVCSSMIYTIFKYQFVVAYPCIKLRQLPHIVRNSNYQTIYRPCYGCKVMIFSSNAAPESLMLLLQSFFSIS